MEDIFERYENAKKNIILLYQKRLWLEKETGDINVLKDTLSEFLEKTSNKIIATINEESKLRDRNIRKLLLEQLRVMYEIRSYCQIIIRLENKELILAKIQKIFEAFGSFINISNKIIVLSKTIHVSKDKSLKEKLRRQYEN